MAIFSYTLGNSNAFTLGDTTKLTAGVANTLTVGTTNAVTIGTSSSLSAAGTFTASLGNTITLNHSDTMSVSPGKAVVYSNTSQTLSKNSVNLKGGCGLLATAQWDTADKALSDVKMALGLLTLLNAALTVCAVDSVAAAPPSTSANGATQPDTPLTANSFDSFKDNKALFNNTVGWSSGTVAANVAGFLAIRKLISILATALDAVKQVGTLKLDADGAVLTGDFSETAAGPFDVNTVSLEKSGAFLMKQTGRGSLAVSAASMLENGAMVAFNEGTGATFDAFEITKSSALIMNSGQALLTAGPAAGVILEGEEEVSSVVRTGASVAVTADGVTMSNPLTTSMAIAKIDASINAPGAINLAAGKSCTAKFSSAEGIALTNQTGSLGINPVGTTIKGKLIRLG